MNAIVRQALGRTNYDVKAAVRAARTQALVLSLKHQGVRWHVLDRPGGDSVVQPAELVQDWLARGFVTDSIFVNGRRYRALAYQRHIYELPGYDPYVNYHEWEGWADGKAT